MINIRKIERRTSLLFFIIIISTPVIGANTDSPVTPLNNNAYFNKIYVDGFGVNSSGFTLMLRTYERHLETQFKPFLADINYVLMTDNQIIYSKRVEQIPLSVEGLGETVLSHQPQVALKEGKNYTGVANIYLYSQGIPVYYLTVSSNFTARNDADITEVYGDGIGASATIKGKSMVPLDARIVFTLKQDERILETKEIAAPSIMSNNDEKTVSILWTNNLNEGTYMVSVLLKGKDIVVNYDKIFTVEKSNFITTPASTNQSVQGSRTTPGFTSALAILAIFVFISIYRRRS